MAYLLENKNTGIGSLNIWKWQIVIFLYCVNFMNIGFYIPLVLLPLILFYLLNNKVSKSFMIALISLISFSVFYSLLALLYDLAIKPAILMYLVYPFVLLGLGYKLVGKDVGYKNTFKYLLTIVVAFSLYGLISVLKTISKYGTMESSLMENGRMTYSLWDDSLIAATGINTYLSFGLAVLPLIFLKKKKYQISLPVKTISLLCFLTSIFCVFQLLNRTGLLIAVLSLVLVPILSEKANIKRYFKLVGWIVLFFVARFIYKLNFLWMKSLWEGTDLYSRMLEQGQTSDPRFVTWGEGFIGLFTNPLGERKASLSLEYVHNLWLDIAYDAGVIPFLLLTFFTFISLLGLVRFLNSDHPSMLKGMFIALFTAFWITFSLEPIIQGWFMYFNIFCFVVGIILRNNNEYKKQSTA